MGNLCRFKGLGIGLMSTEINGTSERSEDAKRREQLWDCIHALIRTPNDRQASDAVNDAISAIEQVGHMPLVPCHEEDCTHPRSAAGRRKKAQERERDVLLGQIHAADLLMKNGDVVEARAELMKSVGQVDAVIEAARAGVNKECGHVLTVFPHSACRKPRGHAGKCSNSLVPE